MSQLAGFGLLGGQAGSILGMVLGGGTNTASEKSQSSQTSSLSARAPKNKFKSSS